MTASANSAVSSRERRSGSSRALVAMPMRAAMARDNTPSTAAPTAAATGTSSATRVMTEHTATAIRAKEGTLTSAPRPRIHGIARTLIPNTRNRLGSSWSAVPMRIGPTRKATNPAAPPRTITERATTRGASARLSRAMQTATVAAVRRTNPASARTAWPPRRAPTMSAILSRRTCATTRDLPPQRHHRTARRTATRASALRAPHRWFPRRVRHRRR